MPLEDFVIHIYLIVDDFLKTFPAYRHRGRKPQVTDGEVITMEIVGEFLGLGFDKRIYSYFKTHWKPWFPKLGSRTSFTRQCANLLGVKEALRQKLVQQKASGCGLYPRGFLHETPGRIPRRHN